LAPGATAIWFSPSVSTSTAANPVGLSGIVATSSVSIPSRLRASTAARPARSSPTAPMKRTCAPNLAAATA
jgi:hypothetical protein